MVGDAILDVVAGLDGVGKLLIVGAGIVHTFELGAIQADALCHLINGLAPVFAMQMHININTFAGIDETGHPAAPDTVGITISLDIQEAVVPAVHNDVIMVGQVQASGGNEIAHRNVRDGINTDHLALGCHCIYDHSVDPVRKRLIHAGSAVKKHIQDLRRSFIRILRLQDVVATLHEVGPGILLGTDQHAVDLGIVIRLVPADGLILKNQKEAPGQRFSGSHILDQPDVIFTKLLALLIVLLRHLLTQHCNMLVRISLAGNGLELQAHG